MLASSIPSRFSVPFAASASGSFKRAVPLTTVTPGAASLTLGFPPITFTPVGAGGIPPDGRDVNGILNQATAWNQWAAAGGPVGYNSAFSSAISGYPLGAVLASATLRGYWLSTTDGNTTNPDTGGAGWEGFTLGAGSTPTPGSWTWRADGNALPGWVRANALTIGNASSGATERANADTAALFAYLWTNFSNTQCPVSGGRGANAPADFAANKTIVVLDLRGTTIMGLDGMGNSAAGRFSGVPFVSGNATTAGSVAGENTHTLTTAETPVHSHSFSATSSTESATHVHGLIGDTGVESVPHNHTPAGGVGAFVVNIGTGGVAGLATGTSVTTDNTTNTESANHTHPLAGLLTGSETAPHTHSVAGTTGTAGSGGAHNNVPRAMVGTHFLKL